jgi:hypothetical protein
MNVAFLSPYFPPHYHPFCRHLKDAGVSVLGIGDAAYDLLSRQVREALTEYYRTESLHDYDALLRACGYFIHRYGRLDRFESLNEFWLDTEARIRDDFNIPGVRGEQIQFIRRKSKMKETFRKAGVSVAQGRVANSLEEGRDFAAAAGYPIVAKPDAGVGALDTFRLETDADLERFYRKKPDVDYFLEAFVTGTIVSFDGLADRDGRAVFHTAHVFSQGIMETVNEARHIYYHSLREVPEDLEALGLRCLEAFQVRERFFHIEFFRTPDGGLVGLEVNMRPPGGFTTDMFNYACDIDIYRAWAHLLAYGDAGLAGYRRDYYCCYASRKARYAYRYDHQTILDRFGDRIRQVESVPGVFSSALGDMGYIFRSPDLEEMREIAAFIQATEGKGTA